MSENIKCQEKDTDMNSIMKIANEKTPEQIRSEIEEFERTFKEKHKD